VIVPIINQLHRKPTNSGIAVGGYLEKGFRTWRVIGKSILHLADFLNKHFAIGRFFG